MIWNVKLIMPELCTLCNWIWWWIRVCVDELFPHFYFLLDSRRQDTSAGRPSCFCRRRTPRRVTLRLSVTPDTHVHHIPDFLFSFLFIYYLPFFFSVGKSNNFSENGLKIISASAAVSAAHRPTMFGRWFWSPPIFLLPLLLLEKHIRRRSIYYTANIFWALRFHVRPDVLNI